jgi:hypothetical protein
MAETWNIMDKKEQVRFSVGVLLLGQPVVIAFVRLKRAPPQDASPSHLPIRTEFDST